jgi:DNA-directed RNA polymerase subunit RPC12/RpoP
MSDPVDVIVDRVLEQVADRFVDRVAEAVATRMAPQRCPYCGDLVHLEADPLVSCPACGSDLVIFRAYDQVHVFARADLDRIDLDAELERLAEISERRRRDP